MKLIGGQLDNYFVGLHLVVDSIYCKIKIIIVILQC